MNEKFDQTGLVSLIIAVAMAYKIPPEALVKELSNGKGIGDYFTEVTKLMVKELLAILTKETA